MAAGTSTATTSGQNWFIAQRWQAYEAESRANLLRICAVGLFYLVHLWTYFSSQGKLPNFGILQLADAGVIGRQFHIAMTLLAVAWALFALAILILLQQNFFPRWLPYASTAFDIVLLTCVVCLGDVARSPLIVGYFLILILAALRLSLPLIWFATVTSGLGYLCVLGVAKWPQVFGIAKLFGADHSDGRVPRYHEVIVMLAILFAGMLLGQVIRRVRRLATGQ
jgi:hypothetical protein